MLYYNTTSLLYNTASLLNYNNISTCSASLQHNLTTILQPNLYTLSLTSTSLLYYNTASLLYYNTTSTCSASLLHINLKTNFLLIWVKEVHWTPARPRRQSQYLLTTGGSCQTCRQLGAVVYSSLRLEPLLPLTFTLWPAVMITACFPRVDLQWRFWRFVGRTLMRRQTATIGLYPLGHRSLRNHGSHSLGHGSLRNQWAEFKSIDTSQKTRTRAPN